MTVYRWKPQAGIAVDAQVAGEELERIRTSRNGRLTQEDVVEEARPKTSPIHDAFEWNDKRAAHKWRLEQASYLIRQITVVYDEAPAAEPIRAFVNVKRGEDRSYVSTAQALSDADLRRQVVAAAWFELRAWRKRHAELIEFARVFALIDQDENAA